MFLINPFNSDNVDVEFSFSVYDRMTKHNQLFKYSFNNLKKRKEVKSLKDFIDKVKEEYNNLTSSTRFQLYYSKIVVMVNDYRIEFVVKKDKNPFEMYVICFKHHCEGGSGFSDDSVISIYDNESGKFYEISSTAIKVY